MQHLRSKSDYSIMIFADSRYNLSSKIRKLPEWIYKVGSSVANVCFGWL